MQKFGQVTLLKDNRTYWMIWSGNDTTFERIDLFKDPEAYNVIDTSTCDAAYYRKNKELFLGNESLIRDVLKTRNVASVFKAPVKQNIEIKDGKAYITQTKEDANLDLKWEIVMENGIIISEIYYTSDMHIDITSVDKNKGVDIPPINLSEYIVYNIMTDKIERQVNDTDYYSLDYLKATYNIDHIEDNDFVVVDNFLLADARLKAFEEAPTKVKSIDLETTGTETGMFGEDVITGIVLSWNEQESTYYPFRQERCEFNLPISYMRKILDVINNQPEDVKIVTFNGKFEIQGIWKEYKHYIKYSEYAKKWDPDCEEHGLEDTYLRVDGDAFFLSILINPVFKQKGAHTLKAEAARADGRFYLELKNIFKDPSNIKFNVLPPEIIRYYACPDGPNTIKVWKRLWAMLPKCQYGIAELENKMIYVTAENEFYGMRTQKELLINLIENEEYKVKTLGDRFKEIHHTNKNVNSPQVRREIFYNKLRCPVEVRTKKGLPSTSNEALKRIVELGTIREYDKNKIPPPIRDLNGDVVVKGEDLVSNRYPSLVILNKYAKAQKELGAYKRIQRTSLRDRVMFYVNQYGAATGRRTSDAHQYSDGMKKLIVADSKHHHLWSCDFKQIELRLLAYLAQQKDLIELESDPDTDIHRAITSIITHQPIWSISAEERKRRKSTNFGVVYMMSAFGLAKKNAGPAYTKEDYEEALKSINDFYAGLPKINEFVRGNEEFVRTNGWIEDIFHRRRNFYEILDPTLPEREKASKVRAANNMPVQGFGAELLKICELNIKDYIKKMGWDEKVDCDGVMLPKVRLMLSIHDEVLVSTHESIPIAAIITMFKECMEVRVKDAPPFFAAPAMVGSWYDGKLDKYEIDLRFRDKVVEAWAKDKTELVHADTYLEDLMAFRANRLKDYMDGLIAKYKTVDEVANHVRHNELTHTLISVMLTKDDKFDHIEAIHEATRRYMENKAKDLNVNMEELSENVEDKGEALTSYEQLEECINFDENGEAIFEEDETSDDEDDLSTLTDASAFYTGRVELERAMYSRGRCTIALVDIKSTDERVPDIEKAMLPLYTPGGDYIVEFMFADGIVPKNFYIGYKPEDIKNAINSVLK